MRDIYSAASETVIYLGPQDGGNTGCSAWNFLGRHSSWALNGSQDRDDTIAARLEEGRIHFRGDIRDVEVDVLSRPWFRRLWVFQEAVVSRYLSIQCGSRRIGWDDFCGIVLRSLRLHDRYGLSLENLDRTDIVRDMCLARREHLRSCGLRHLLPSWQLSESSNGSIGALHVLKLLARARYLEASDPRDKIFGLLGIATGIDTTDPKFAVDYRLHYQQLYVDFARHFIETTSSYDIISYVDSMAETSLHCSDRSSNLPSWVPNWNYEDYRSGGRNKTILETLPRGDADPEERSPGSRCRVLGSES